MSDCFQQNADGTIVVVGGAYRYCDTQANFEADYGKTVPALPAGATARVYLPGSRNTLKNGDDVVGGDVMPWAFGDAAIAAITTIIDAKTARIGTPASVTPTPTELVNTFRDTRLAGGFSDAATGNAWQCDDYSQGKWTAIGSSAGLSIVMGTSPAPTFDMIAADNSTATLSAVDAFALINGRLMPWVSATMLYARSLKDQIAAGNPPTDITAGWPANTG